MTVDPELEAAMAVVDPRPRSRSRLIRDLAIRGAQAERDARQRRSNAIEHLLSIARGVTPYDFARATDIHTHCESSLD